MYVLKKIIKPASIWGKYNKIRSDDQKKTLKFKWQQPQILFRRKSGPQAVSQTKFEGNTEEIMV